MSFYAPTRVHAGRGAIGQLPGLLTGPTLIVTDPQVRKLDWFLQVESGLPSDCRVYADVEPNPRTTTATAIAQRARESAATTIVAIGGGSVIDAAKGAAVLASNEAAINDLVGRDQFRQPPLPLIAVPTTCGTGSEVTPVAVLSDEVRGIKVSIKGDRMFPHHAIVDPQLIDQLPAKLVASTGFDALTHALEAYVSGCANPISDALAAEATTALLSELGDAVAGSPVARAQVMFAATVAGMSFCNADVGAAHCISESIGGLLDLPHGELNAALLAPVLSHHLPVCGEKLTRLARMHGLAENAEELVARVESLRQQLGLKSLGEFTIPERLWPKIASASEQNGSNNSNPQPMSAADYLALINDTVTTSRQQSAAGTSD